MYRSVLTMDAPASALYWSPNINNVHCGELGGYNINPCHFAPRPDLSGRGISPALARPGYGGSRALLTARGLRCKSHLAPVVPRFFGCCLRARAAVAWRASRHQEATIWRNSYGVSACTISDVFRVQSRGTRRVRLHL